MKYFVLVICNVFFISCHKNTEVEVLELERKSVIQQLSEFKAMGEIRIEDYLTPLNRVDNDGNTYLLSN